VVASGLEKFTCSLNLEVEDFLRFKALTFEKAKKSRTYLMLDENDQSGFIRPLAYFSISIHLLDVNGVHSSTMRKSLFGLYYSSSTIQTFVPCYLLGQLGRDDNASSIITGDELVALAIGKIQNAHVAVGGRFIKLDCENVPTLQALYRRHGFQPVQRLEGRKLIEMVRFF
jgi:hypothetical protein